MLGAKKAKKKGNGQVDIPPEIAARAANGDYVAYTAIHNKTEQKRDMPTAACYSAHMSTLSEHLFICKPQGKFVLPHDVFLQWMELCKDHGLCPLSSEFVIEKGVPLAKIPGGNESKHRIYTALCCYRYAESIAPLCYEAVKLVEERPHLDFFQILHYCMGRYVAHVGHSFSHLCNTTYSMYGGKACRLDLIHTIGMKWWYEMDKFGKSLCGNAPNGTTNDALYTYCTGLKVNIKIKNEVDALDPKYTPLYKVTRAQGAEEVKKRMKMVA